MEFINISDTNLNANIDKQGLKKLIILPDHSPGRGKLPVGSVAVYSKKEHTPYSELLGPDIGCGMLLAKFKSKVRNLEDSVNGIAEKIISKNKGFGSLGGGNHFINFYKVKDSNISPIIAPSDQTVLIHSGSRDKGNNIYKEKLSGEDYIRKQSEILEYSKNNRKNS